MPSIIIREKDNTTSAGVEYSNFAVVVPGAYDKRIGDGAFDENGIYECNDKNDFITNVGLVAPSVSPALAAHYASPQVDWEEGVTFVDRFVVEHLSEEDFWRKDYQQVYTYVKLDDPVDPGRNKFKYTYLVNSETKVTEYYEFVKAETYDSENNYKYVIVLKGDEGNDAQEYSFSIMGNQIAYELLRLGYTVLYKKINYFENESESNKLNLAELDTEEYWNCLLDKSVYDFRYIMLGGYNSSDAQSRIATIAKFNNDTEIGRGDCIALIDIDDSEFVAQKSQKLAAQAIEAAAIAINNTDTNAAFFAPTITYSDASNLDFNLFADNHIFPASFHYLACAKYAQKSFAEWYAVGGYERGRCDLVIEATGYKFGEVAVNALAPRTTDAQVFKFVNLIINEKNNFYIWGNRTAEALLSGKELKASHFLNIRQLCTTLKKRLYVLCRQFSFDPNSDLLWVNFCAAIRPTLDNMKADQGITDYRLLKVEDGAKAKLTAYVRIVPIEAVEDFDITVFLEDNLNGSVSVQTLE